MGQRQSRRAERDVRRAKQEACVRQLAADFEQACCVCEKGRFMSLALYRIAFFNYAYHACMEERSRRHLGGLSDKEIRNIEVNAMAHWPETQNRDVSLSLSYRTYEGYGLPRYILGMDLVHYPTAETVESPSDTARPDVAE